jgi:hypothetical protein
VTLQTLSVFLAIKAARWSSLSLRYSETESFKVSDPALMLATSQRQSDDNYRSIQNGMVEILFHEETEMTAAILVNVD